MQYVDYKVLTGEENMRIDAQLLDDAIKNGTKEPIFRLYGWSPACVSLGRNQKDDFLDYEELSSLGLDVVRRLTGGRALLHDDEITYSVICPAAYLPHGENVAGSYKDICQILIDKFAQIGIELTLGAEKGVHTKFDYCMLVSTGADLCYQGKKLIGSAQFRKKSSSPSPACPAPAGQPATALSNTPLKRLAHIPYRESFSDKEGYILQHGSILYDYNRELLEKIFKEPVSTEEIIGLKEINPQLTKSDVIELLSNVTF